MHREALARFLDIDTRPEIGQSVFDLNGSGKTNLAYAVSPAGCHENDLEHLDWLF